MATIFRTQKRKQIRPPESGNQSSAVTAMHTDCNIELAHVAEEMLREPAQASGIVAQRLAGVQRTIKRAVVLSLYVEPEVNGKLGNGLTVSPMHDRQLLNEP